MSKSKQEVYINTINTYEEYWSPYHSGFIDDDIKDEFKNKSSLAETIVMIQLIKELKKLNENLRK